MTGGPDPEAPRASPGEHPPDSPTPSAAEQQDQAGGSRDARGSSAAQESRAAEESPAAKESPAAEESPAARATRTAQGAQAARAGTNPGRGDPGRGDPDRGFRIAAAVVKPLMRAWFRIRLVGEEHIPETGPVILASNHRSNMDPVLLASAVRRPVAFMAKAELFVGPLGWILRWIGQFPVRRGGIDRVALRQTDEVLARGSMLGLFPEGTRGEGTFSAVHPGLAYIVVRQRCPVLPVVILGTERVRRRFGWLPFASPVRIVIGPAIDLPQSTSDRAGRRAASELLQRRLQAFTATVGGAPVAPSTSSQSNE